jgi:hypothetical protein
VNIWLLFYNSLHVVHQNDIINSSDSRTLAATSASISTRRMPFLQSSPHVMNHIDGMLDFKRLSHENGRGDIVRVKCKKSFNSMGS